MINRVLNRVMVMRRRSGSIVSYFLAALAQAIRFFNRILMSTLVAFQHRKKHVSKSLSCLTLTLLACVNFAFLFSTAQAQDSNPAPPAAPTATTQAPALPPYPLDSVIDKQGIVVTVDRNLPGIWKTQDQKSSVFVKGPKKFRQPLNAIRTIAFDHEGKLLVGDTSTRDIYRIADNGTATPITGGEIGIPMDIAVKPDGTIYVADLELHKLMRIPAGSKKVEHVAEVNPRGVFVDSEEKIWVVSQDAQQLIIVADDGQKEVIVGSRVFEFPHQVVVNSKGEAFVSDGYKKAIWKVVRGQAPVIAFEGAPLDNPVGLALFEDQVIITDPRAAKVFKLTAENKLEVLADFSTAVAQ